MHKYVVGHLRIGDKMQLNKKSINLQKQILEIC